MNQRSLLNTVIAISIPSIAVFFVVPALALVQLPASSIQNQQVTVAHSSAIAITLPKLVKFDTGQSLPTLPFLTQPFLVSAGMVIDAAVVDCNNIAPGVNVQTTEGIRPLSVYCQAKSINLQQPAPNIQTTPRLPWGTAYWLNGNVCRERGADTVCLTPQEANNLRWLTPPGELTANPS